VDRPRIAALACLQLAQHELSDMAVTVEIGKLGISAEGDDNGRFQFRRPDRQAGAKDQRHLRVIGHGQMAAAASATRSLVDGSRSWRDAATNDVPRPLRCGRRVHTVHECALRCFASLAHIANRKDPFRLRETCRSAAGSMLRGCATNFDRRMTGGQLCLCVLRAGRGARKSATGQRYRWYPRFVVALQLV